MAELKGDELILYGFKRIIEDIGKLNDRLDQLEKIEQNTYTSSSEAIKQTLLLEKIENSAAICMFNSSGLMNDVRKMSMRTDGGQKKE